MTEPFRMTREEAIEILEIQISSAEFYARYTHNDKDAEKELKHAEAFRMAIKALQVDRPHGEWVETTSGTICSNCGEYPYDDGEYHIANWYSDFCPSCGADMGQEK